MTRAEPTIRRAGQHDVAPAADVWLRSRRASVPAIPAPVHSDADVHRFFHDIVFPERALWVAADGDVVVAVMVLDGAWLDQLYVEPEWCGRGIGSDLVALAKILCPDGLDLWAFESNEGARRFYERHGFVAVDRTDGDNEEGAPDVRYAWRPQ
jgi:GNAT superfamily N-acetyltransferase